MNIVSPGLSEVSLRWFTTMILSSIHLAFVLARLGLAAEGPWMDFFDTSWRLYRGSFDELIVPCRKTPFVEAEPWKREKGVESVSCEECVFVHDGE